MACISDCISRREGFAGFLGWEELDKGCIRCRAATRLPLPTAHDLLHSPHLSPNISWKTCSLQSATFQIENQPEIVQKLWLLSLG